MTSADAPSTRGVEAEPGADAAPLTDGPGRPVPGADRPYAPDDRRTRSALPAPVVVVAGAAALVAAGAMCWSGLNHDVRYVLGGMRASGRGGFSASGVFVHRPLAYRWLLSGLDHLTGGPVAVREAWIRLLVIVLTVALACWLRGGLARFLPRREATSVALAVGLVLVYAPAWDFLQPEWVAAWRAGAGGGASAGAGSVPGALGGARQRPGAGSAPGWAAVPRPGAGPAPGPGPGPRVRTAAGGARVGVRRPGRGVPRTRGGGRVGGRGHGPRPLLLRPPGRRVPPLPPGGVPPRVTAGARSAAVRRRGVRACR